ncbi:MAG: 16S rRNA (guanine(527)-N(7))-methyltransferase RsmG [Clostridia bacterium]|nr:16S rRNA (guanine(527)-N(7))-methyltransferase RsmG [Clostridia bacterium]
MICEMIREKLKINKIPFTDDLPEKLEIYLKLLTEWNEKMDLTAVPDDRAELADRHFIDSLTILRTEMIPSGSSLIDVGTGAGFPGMVLALARPDLTITLLDAQQKRLTFLEAVIKNTGAENTVLLHSRAEDAARERKHREQYDFATARALAPMNVLSEYLLPFVRIGGCALCWKGPALQQEAESGRRAAHLLGARLEMPIRCDVAGRDWDHRILPLRKIEKTPSAYPRKAGIPKGNPLGESKPDKKA